MASMSVLARVGTSLVVAFVASRALAMGIQETKTLLVKSADGASALYEVRGHGPEGGGSLGYRIDGAKRGDRTDYVVSSTFSPGNGSRPQTVSAGECARRVAALTAALAARHFPAVATHPERCQTPSRDDIVTVTR
jgi:hypothetical protein